MSGRLIAYYVASRIFRTAAGPCRFSTAPKTPSETASEELSISMIASYTYTLLATYMILYTYTKNCIASVIF